MRDIFIANTAEAFADLLEKGTAGTPSQQEQIQHELDLSQRAQFWGTSAKILITPEPIPYALMDINKKRLGYNNVVNLWPSKPGLRLSQCIINDADLLGQLIKHIQASPGIRISPYAITRDFIHLLKVLESMAPQWSCGGMSHDLSVAEVAARIDSKCGFREMCADLFSSGQVRLPEGFACVSAADVVNAIRRFRESGRGCVIKIHNGESGLGIRIISHDEMRVCQWEAITEWVRTAFASDPLWSSSPYVVEEYISVDRSIGGGFPSGEGHVTDDGFVFDYECGQELTNGGMFEGIVLDAHAIPDPTTALLRRSMMMIGERYHEIGFRGTFDVDFAAGTDGMLYPLECNARRTGGTHVYELMIHLGLSPFDGCALSNDVIRYRSEILEPHRLETVLSKVLYPINGGKRGVAISFISRSRPIVGIVAIGHTAEDARELIRRTQACLEIGAMI